MVQCIVMVYQDFWYPQRRQELCLIQNRKCTSKTTEDIGENYSIFLTQGTKKMPIIELKLYRNTFSLTLQRGLTEKSQSERNQEKGTERHKGRERVRKTLKEHLRTK